MTDKEIYWSLSHRDRDIVGYRHSGISYKEIAAMYGLTKTKVKKIYKNDIPESAKLYHIELIASMAKRDKEIQAETDAYWQIVDKYDAEDWHIKTALKKRAVEVGSD